MNKLLIYICIFLLYSIPVTATDPPIFDYIDGNDLDSISEFLTHHNINGIYGPDSITILSYSIISGQVRTVDFLLNQGADPNQFVKGKSPLMYAIESGSRRKVKILLDYNANINAMDKEGNHSLIYAAIKGDVGIIKTLLRNGAYLNHKNKEFISAYNMAVTTNNPDAAKYLKFTYEKHLPDLHDGPYITWKNNDKIKAFYLSHDSTKNTSKKITKTFRTDSEPFIMKGFSKDVLDYPLWKTAETAPSRFKNINKLLITGDIHGGYDSLVTFLQSNHVIDSKLNWTWKDGHLLFLGDIFDRGDKVTEALWLIYKLEHQAIKSGGFVHYLLGNHEILVLLKNQLYIDDKYLYLTKRLNLTYSYLFNKRTILGQWLSAKNTIIKIDDKLFVHAGISPEVAELELSIDEMNKMVRFFLNHPERNRKYGKENKELLLGMKGPFWYRGYLEDNTLYEQISEEKLDQILQQYGVSKIFVGHNNVDEITTLFNNKIYFMDVPFYTHGYSMQAILIENENIYILDTHGNKEKCNL